MTGSMYLWKSQREKLLEPLGYSAASTVKHGVVMADILEGSGKVMTVAEAPERHMLAELTIQALISVEAIVSQIQLLPVQNVPDNDVINMFSPARALADVGKLYNK